MLAADALLVTVGDVTPTSAVVWARGVAPGTGRVELAPASAPLARAGEIEFAAARDLTGKLVLSGLAPSTRYGYRVTAGTRAVTGEFVTAPAPEALTPFTFAWSGDLGGGDFCRHLRTGYPIFQAIAARRPHFFLFVGDTIYADRACQGPERVPGYGFIATTLAGYHDKHRYNRADGAVQAAFRVTSVYAIWDDHEVRNDFSGPTEPLMPAGRQAFVDYWPIVPPDAEAHRLYRRFRWGKLLDLFILDTRQYRSPNAEVDQPGKTMLGAAQRQWLIDGVAGSDAVWKVVVSSVPLAIPTGRRERRDSWTNATAFGLPDTGGTGFAHERDAILAALRERGVKNMVVVAADVHHAEIIRHAPAAGLVFHELIAGPLSASVGTPRPLDQTLNAISLWGRGGINNFGEVAVEPTQLVVRIVDETGAVLGTHTIARE